LAVELVWTDYIRRRSNMARSPCLSKEGLKRGAWTAQEDMILLQYIRIHGHGEWGRLPERAGLKRCGKSCRLRWMNYLRPNIKRGNISPAEEELIIRLHRLLGNRWSLIAGRLPGRTDNEIKNYWNSHLCKKLLPVNQSQPKWIKHNFNRSSKDPLPPQNYVYRAIPVRIKSAVKHSELVSSNSCKGFSYSEIPCGDHTSTLCNGKEIMNSPKSSWDLLLNNDWERMDFGMADVNLIETETINSTCFRSNLVNPQLQLSDQFAEDATTIGGISCNLNEISSSQTDFSTLFGLEDFDPIF